MSDTEKPALSFNLSRSHTQRNVAADRRLIKRVYGVNKIYITPRFVGVKLDWQLAASLNFLSDHGK